MGELSRLLSPNLKPPRARNVAPGGVQNSTGALPISATAHHHDFTTDEHVKKLQEVVKYAASGDQDAVGKFEEEDG